MMPSISELARYGRVQAVHSIGMKLNQPSVLQKSALSSAALLTGTKLFGLSENFSSGTKKKGGLFQAAAVPKPLYSSPFLHSSPTGLVIDRKI